MLLSLAMQPSFEPLRFETPLVSIIREIRAAERLDANAYHRIVRRHARPPHGSFSKSEIIRGFRALAPSYGWDDEEGFLDKVRMKPVRTESGVAPVTVLTQPYPCPGRCIFCPNDVRMPKSYLSREPGAQRAAQFRFDPYAQTLSRLIALYNTGHRVDKVELLILGGTWSFYPEPYQVGFVKRCFDALNDFAADPERLAGLLPRLDPASRLDFDELLEVEAGTETYNQRVADYLFERLGDDRTAATERASWEELERAQRLNETREARGVGLVLETRPDHVTPAEVRRLRRLGATKVQIGIQSLSDPVLAANRRGHDVATTRRALHLLRQAGFKLHAHWMPNLYGSDPAADVEDFGRLFDDPGVRPDELKIYPCSLIESAELMRHWQDGSWRPYTEGELLDVLGACLLRVPPYCRVTRVIRDIPGQDIVDGNKVTNFREVVERHLQARGLATRDIRSREIRRQGVELGELRLERLDYETSVGEEAFFQFVTGEDRLAGFLRLSLPGAPVFLDEIAGEAMIREVHVYGAVVGLGEAGAEGPGRSQHLGLGRRLIAAAAELANERGFPGLAVISSVGTREYYRALGFADGELYQHRSLPQRS